VKARPDFFAMTRFVPWVFAALVLLFLAAPLFVVVPAAFNESTLLHFPPRHWSLRWFHEYFASSSWIDATKTSFKVGVVVSVVSTCLGLTTAVVLTRYSFAGRNLLRALVMAPLVVPVIVIAVGLYYVFLRIGINGTFWGLVIGHTLVTFPYATVVISAALLEVDERLENAAVGLGAARPRAFVEVTLPLIRPGLAVAALFGFLISFDEVVIAIFLTSAETMTLPRRIWDGIRFELNPTIAAVSTVLIALSALIMLASELLRAQLRRMNGMTRRKDA
jgi:ABC-type spermidine/putrescine transport system permease subunit II